MRANLMKGEIIELRRRARRRRKVRLVLLCDVSGSMDLYSRFLLQFLYALQNVFGRVETFTFATRLTRVSDLLRGPSYKRALRRLTKCGTGRAARASERPYVTSTRSGDAWWTGGRSCSFSRTAGIRASRTSSPRKMLTLKRRAGRVLWLNPLLGNPSYEPLTRGMAAALPLVDHFAAAHNLSSLRELATHLTLR
jgi:uncharacterized protein with von Willebrand factor type A (vWA) domain